MAEKRLRLGLVGFGRAAQTLHLPALRYVHDWQVTAIADSDTHRAQEAARRFGIARCYSDYRKLIEDADVEAIAVCVPPRLHAEVALAALEAGKHVFIEKPLAVSLEDCDRIARGAARSPGKAMVGLNLRWHPLVRRAREILKSNTLGELALVRTQFTTANRSHPGTPAWASRREHGGGVLFDLGVHHFDLWRHLTGTEVAEVFCTTQTGEGDDASAVVAGRMATGLCVCSVFSDCTRDANELELCGRKGTLRVSLYRFDGLELTDSTTPADTLGARFRRVPATLKELPRALAQAFRGGSFLAAYCEEWRHFARVIRVSAPVECTIEDGRRAVEVSLAALASAAESRAIRISDVAQIPPAASFHAPS